MLRSRLVGIKQVGPGQMQQVNETLVIALMWRGREQKQAGRTRRLIVVLHVTNQPALHEELEKLIVRCLHETVIEELSAGRQPVRFVANHQVETARLLQQLAVFVPLQSVNWSDDQ